LSFGRAGSILNRTQLLALGFLLIVWIALVAILALSPEVYAQTLRQVPGDVRTIDVIFLAAL
jgi:threonine/homoserine/homoserine lactone efflux protein